uniref:Leucine zipper tumor suppressor 2 n=1 Tax=Amphilophus citrinellus TaxID=61819 RepID=A0A3Q0SWA5_AMPCI
MGSVSSLISGRTYQERHCRAASEFATKPRRSTPATSCFRLQDNTLRSGSSLEQLLVISNQTQPQAQVLPPPLPTKKQPRPGNSKVLIRPTAFKPVVPKNRHSVHYLSPRPGGSTLSESQASLNLLLPHGGSSSSSGTSDSGRNSLSSLPTHSSTGYSLAPSEGSSAGSGSGGQLEPVSGVGRNTSGGSGSHGHSNSDSGRSSSSKSTGSGSLSGRGQPLSDSGSCGHSPPAVEGYEAVVRELEEKLRERDLELQQLRENLDENEAAICQVYEEKQRRCEREMEELRQSCAMKMKQASQKAQRAQQVLQLQVFQLQQEKKKLQEDFSSLLQDRETLERRCATIQREQTQLGPRLEETKWEVCQKSGEISLLKQQLKEIQSELSQKAGDIVVLKAQLREARSELQASQARAQEAQAALRTRSLELEVCENELQRRKSEAELLREKVGRLEEESARLRDALSSHSGPILPGNVDRLKAELMYERRTSEEQLSRFDEERRVWQEEKEKVIHYQKQLQQNYIQMYRRNRDLERVMRELSLELENRDMEDYEVRSGSNDIHFEEITATEI